MEVWQYNYGPVRSDELYHYGIKGQKWGVRRYQNKDGSLTPLGKKRYIGMGVRDGEYSSEKDARSRIRFVRGDSKKAISGVERDAKETKEYYKKQFDESDRMIKRFANARSGIAAGVTAASLGQAALSGVSANVLVPAGAASLVAIYGFHKLNEVLNAKVSKKYRDTVQNNIERYKNETIDEIRRQTRR